MKFFYKRTSKTTSVLKIWVCNDGEQAFIVKINEWNRYYNDINYLYVPNSCAINLFKHDQLDILKNNSYAELNWPHNK